MDIGGFLTSTEFVAQIASIVATILVAIATQLITTLFGGATAA